MKPVSLGKLREAAPTATVENGLYVVVTTDLKDSTKSRQELGDILAGGGVERHREIVENISAPLGGDIIGFAGDSFGVRFSTPSNAIKFALHLQTAHGR